MEESTDVERAAIIEEFENEFAREKKKHYILDRVIRTGKKLGEGSFGEVEVVTYREIECAGKKLKENYTERNSKQWLEECKLMSSLRHPNIAQFLGICFTEHSLPILVMELLEATLYDIVMETPGLPFSLKCSVLADVASGLLYLHKGLPGSLDVIVHNDLNAKNVLLTSSQVAKISDVGYCYITKRCEQRKKSQYMPRRNTREYDIFYFGALALFTVLQTNVGHMVSSTIVTPRTKIWETYFEGLKDLCPLNFIKLVERCLLEKNRPDTGVLLAEIRKMQCTMVKSYGGPIKFDMVRLKQAKELKRLEKQNKSYKAELQNLKAGNRENLDELVACLEKQGLCTVRRTERGWNLKYIEDGAQRSGEEESSESAPEVA